MSLLLSLTDFTPCPSVSVVNFEHVIANWEDIDLAEIRLNQKLHEKIRVVLAA